MICCMICLRQIRKSSFSEVQVVIENCSSKQSFYSYCSKCICTFTNKTRLTRINTNIILGLGTSVCIVINGIFFSLHYIQRRESLYLHFFAVELQRNMADSIFLPISVLLDCGSRSRYYLPLFWQVWYDIVIIVYFVDKNWN